ncbi:DUF1588 domain-containing protein [Lignipirellula cremea]|uniref:Cytochrome c domain-containing protein n=1 Tax=Lignipirellula cremea TaxID=2528010 RepID=A0A518DLU0_9BACT|nr:DUF1588 domain-containing protein [Lignipirellula cremea]QDU92799.1 hypothetical protein Pla8534_05720 [Lignipirellula cremea]
MNVLSPALRLPGRVAQVRRACLACGVWLAYVFCLGASVPTLAGEPVDEASARQLRVGFDQTAGPFLLQHCVDCHGADDPAGGVSLHPLDPTRLGGDDAALWQKVLQVLKFGQMPPPGEPQPERADLDRMTSWIQAELAAAGQESDVDHKLLQPAYANLLQHEKLFDGSITGPAFSRPRLWRIHPEAYDQLLVGFGRELTLGGPLSKPFTVGEGKGLAANYAALMQADSATLGQLMLNCRQIAQLQTTGFVRQEQDRKTKEMVEKIHRRAPDSFAAILDSPDAPTAEQIAAAVAEEFQLVLLRSPSKEEAADFTDLLQRAIAVGGKAGGLRTLAMAVLMRPEAIYRMEVGLGDTTADGRRMLSPYELAHALAYALTDLPPDQVLLGPRKNNRPGPPSLLDLARDGQLQSRDDVLRVATQMWDNEELQKPRVLRFFQEFFGYAHAETVFKGDRAGKEFHTKILVKDADDLVLHLVRQDREVLRELLTTDRFFVQWPGSQAEYDRKIQYITERIKPGNKADRNYKYFVARVEQGLRPMPQANPTWRSTVRFYNLHENTWDYPLEQPFPMPPGERVGLLTHPAWLAAWSGNFENDPIRRGKWIRENLLAGAAPEAPITVDASVPEDPHKTLRQRLTVTRQEYCWKCHQNMEPLALPLEAYDDFGQFRTVEGLGDTRALTKPKSTAPLETHGQIIHSGDPAIDGPVRDVHELMQRLASSSRVRQSFVRHAFRYWLGRNEMLSDSPTLIAADQAYVEQDGSFKALVLSLLTSDSFLYRK